MERNFWKKNLEKKFWKKNVVKKVLTTKIFKKSFDNKNFGKMNSKTKIFITKLYSNIDKCHTIFALLAPFDKTGRRTGSNENVCGIWFKIGSRALALDARNVAIRTKSGEKIYHGLRAVGNSLTTCSGLVPGLPLQ